MAQFTGKVALDRRPAMSHSISTLLTRNLHEVFGEAAATSFVKALCLLKTSSAGRIRRQKRLLGPGASRWQTRSR
jgi:hypothetical protein